MPELVETQTKFKDDDNIVYNTKLKLMSEKIHEKSNDNFFCVNA